MNFGNLFSGLSQLTTSISAAVNPVPVGVAGAPGVIYDPSTGQLISTSSLSSIGGSGIGTLLIIGLVAWLVLK